jgi:hypothetical protein
MPGERQLARHREDPVAIVGATGGRGLHEGGLGQPGLDRKRKHRPLVQPIRVVNDRERIAGEADVGEDVQQGVAQISR